MGIVAGSRSRNDSGTFRRRFVLEVGESSHQRLPRDPEAATLNCPGPGGATCPLVEEGECGYIDLADAFVLEFDLTVEYNRTVLAAYKERAGRLGIPLVVVASHSVVRDYPELLDGVVVKSHIALVNKSDCSAHGGGSALDGLAATA